MEYWMHVLAIFVGVVIGNLIAAICSKKTMARMAEESTLKSVLIAAFPVGFITGAIIYFLDGILIHLKVLNEISMDFLGYVLASILGYLIANIIYLVIKRIARK